MVLSEQERAELRLSLRAIEDEEERRRLAESMLRAGAFMSGRGRFTRRDQPPRMR